MPGIIRRAVGDTERSSKKRMEPSERKFDDHDFQWESEHGTIFTVWIIDAHEWFNNRTSSKGTHKYFGPSLVVAEQSPYGYKCDEHFVNDPEIWQWINKSIREGWLGPKSIKSNCG